MELESTSKQVWLLVNNQEIIEILFASLKSDFHNFPKEREVYSICPLPT